MKNNRLRFLNIMTVVCLILLMFPASVWAAPLSVGSRVIFLKEVSSPEAHVGDTVTFTLRFKLAATETQPINVKVSDVNPAPQYLDVVDASVTGGATYDANTDTINWTGLLSPGSQEKVVTFQALVKGTPPAGGTVVTNVASMVDAVVPGSLPLTTAQATLTVLPGTGRVIFLKEVSSPEAHVGDTITFTLRFKLAATETQAINVKVSDVNPAPQYLDVVDASVTGGATYDANTDTINWAGLLSPGSQEKVVTFQALVKGPVAGAVVTNVATMTDVYVPGSLPPTTAQVNLTVLPGLPTLPVVAFDSATYSADEGAGSVNITVILSQASGSPVQVNYATSNGTATAGSDYVAASGTLTFAAGETSKTFAVTISEDALDEVDETVNLTLNTPVNATLGYAQPSTLTITDNDAAPTVSFSSAAVNAAEGAGTAVVTVNLSAPSAKVVTVNYATSNGTATAGSDYAAAAGTLTFAAGETSKTFAVTISEDALDEVDETVNLALSTPVNCTLGTPNTAVLTITDNDAEPTVSFSNATYMVAEKAGSIVITVNLSAASGKTVSVNYATSNGTAIAPVDYTSASGTLTFAPGETTKTFTVAVSDDAWTEVTETVILTLSQPTNTTIGTLNPAILSIIDEKTGLLGRVLCLPVMAKPKMP